MRHPWSGHPQGLFRSWDGKETTAQKEKRIRQELDWPKELPPIDDADLSDIYSTLPVDAFIRMRDPYGDFD